jgi:hypothetical protein
MKLPPFWPAAIVRLEGTETPELSADRLTTAPPESAALVNVTVTVAFALLRIELGLIETELTVGLVAALPPTVMLAALEVAPPKAFWTVTPKLPAPSSVSAPMTCDEVLVISAAFRTTHGLQPGPANRICALDGSKFVPVIVNVNCCPCSGAFGVVSILVTDG